MEKISIEARNNLDIPIRLSIIITGGGREESRILVTIGSEGASLRSYFRICIDADIIPTNEWQEVGSLAIDTKSHISVLGLDTNDKP